MKAAHQGTTSDRTCFFCKRTGHVKADCKKYLKWKNKKEKANKVTHESPVLDMCNLVVSSEPVIEKALLGKISEKPTECWLVDSGATSHMVNSRDFFIDLDSSRKGCVRLADEEKLAEVKGVGKGVIKCVVEDNKISEMCIADVLYVPSLSSSLLSVKKLSKSGFKVIFENNDCLITKNRELKAIAKLSPELYRIRTAERACAASGAINLGHREDCQHTWHRRFGHRDIDAIKDLARKELATGIVIKDCGIQETCECCVRGKLARSPFPKEAIKKSQAILDLVHTDVCGPLRTVTPSQKRYTLTIIDDYSRYCTTFFLQYKSEAAACIKNFVEMTKTQYGKKPKIIRSDRGREYVNDDLQRYLKTEGIRVQYTAAYSPQQNGVAERKNRSLMEMARCMLLDAKLENKFWAEAVSTANYLQNILPTKAAQKTPYELWTSKKPDVQNLHIFGCRAYVYVHKEQRGKLDEKSEQMVFVGYSAESKAFRFLNTETNRIKISRDAVFIDKEKPIPDNTVYIEFPKNEQLQAHEEIVEDSTDTSDEEYESLDSESSEDLQSEPAPDEDPQPEPASGKQCRRSQRTNRGVPPDRYVAKHVSGEEEKEPSSVKEALSGPHREVWKNAMNDEVIEKSCRSLKTEK